ncbi:hypothetical protein PHLH8_37590 [Pseudomonas sp. Pc102]|uniref:PaaI family thioesterase n=1 Tax=Pseudomonas sp. Pc102 TaxID=2678261 RepID=UPI001BCB5C05|nr:PaaI family thioesterase [Pseudomonas sp. Pc102]BBP84117.1 hypothetical protein PHLH8_37590 [Pseudomonas sp. Pc102]
MTDTPNRTPPSGLQILQAVIAGRLPAPAIGETMGMMAVDVEPGRIFIEARPDVRHLNPARTVHGGFTATCLDGAAGLALFSTLPGDAQYATVDLGVKYLRPLKAGELYRVEGWVVERTRSLAICDAHVVDASGKLCARATTTFSVRD